jgi:hypothetical protein
MRVTATTTAIARHAGKRRRGLRDDRWREALPDEWTRLAVAPLAIEEYRDYEADAARLIGRDEDGRPCFTKHRFVLTEWRSDDGEDFYAIVTYGEAMTAWLLRDGRWLIHRIVVRDGEIEHGRGFYSLSESMPR